MSVRRLAAAYAVLGLAVWVSWMATRHSSTAPTPGMVSATVEFRVSGPGKPLAGARVLVVGPNGQLIANGLTNDSGTWSVALTVPADPRFPTARPALGTVTALALADGYVEQLFFDVPVREGAVQVIVLRPVQPDQRNEPGYQLGMLHRLDVLPLVDYYREQAGLGKQRR